MASPPTDRLSGPLRVEVRRPMHRPHPLRALRGRWRAQTAQRRAERAQRREDGEKLKWWEFADVPFTDVGIVGAVFVAVLAVIGLTVFFVFAAPFVWLVVLFLVELILWVLLAVAGIVAWLVFRRPWRVVVVDSAGTTVAEEPVSGRRSALAHAETVRSRLASEFAPADAVRRV